MKEHYPGVSVAVLIIIEEDHLKKSLNKTSDNKQLIPLLH